jgi:2-hydroxychromene-2-carboxylate isomerase
MDQDERLQIVAYTDYKSPYAFVANAATEALARQYPIDLTWLPYTLRIAEFMGSVEERTPHFWRKVRYAYMDARRIANRHGLILKGPRRIYEGELSSIGMLFAQAQGCFEAYHASTFERFWCHDLDIDSMDEMVRHLDALGASGAEFERFARGAGAVQHGEILLAAEAQGVFGVPTLVMNGELYWGGDRLPMLREAIEQHLLDRAAAHRAKPEGRVR